MHLRIIDNTSSVEDKMQFHQLQHIWTNQLSSLGQVVDVLSDSAYVRRRSNIKGVLKYLCKSNEYDFTPIIEKIVLWGEKLSNFRCNMLSTKSFIREWDKKEFVY